MAITQLIIENSKNGNKRSNYIKNIQIHGITIAPNFPTDAAIPMPVALILVGYTSVVYK